ncbi:oxidoreductase NAD-binding domain-containing protein 1-like [Eriocheir sinensis]|uniref:oxidoreductase NAD-binding domain-containing protein 1-like n=1 Tax=Eriocheir sinensis TaxID=95602 RepID=UPI0021C6C993|nr:oxidoreductase NAD-binding domain-containing protein 1-like [Eriocheir sinensis]
MRVLLRGFRSPFPATYKFIARTMTTKPTPESPPPPLPSDGAQAVSEGRGGKHLKITAQQSRQPVTAAATVTALRQASPSVRCITLTVHDPTVTFKAGQWVDLFIPGQEVVGGFSMASPPSQLAGEGVMVLGVKYSKWPPARWVHEECEVGAEVAIRVGGDFHYPPPPHSPPSPQQQEEGVIGGEDLPPYPLLLVGGGVGVNPLASILLQLGRGEGAGRGVEGVFLYSARSYEELLYKEEMNAVAENIKNLEIRYFTTREPPPDPSLATYGRISPQALTQAARALTHPHPPLCYLCGPPPMIEDICQHLVAAGVPRGRVLYEKWW